MNGEHLIDIKDLEVSFFTPSGEVKAVRGVSWHLDEGEAIGIVGESGSGKSVSVYCHHAAAPESPGKVIGRFDHLQRRQDLLGLSGKGNERKSAATRLP